ncbi:hypothetical protein [uncultured Algibacter sp.]|uniref:hypothetical protein n=1 Tax=uncultured Algibacter sp. TaxID=298659 RepID=UPI00261E0852|nr:hypothetical protein [uncultured Algibacter sp.]
MNSREYFLGKEVAKAEKKFYESINNIKEKYADFLKENNIDFDNSINVTIDQFSAVYNITNEKVKSKMESEIETAYQDAFSDLLNDLP